MDYALVLHFDDGATARIWAITEAVAAATGNSYALDHRITPHVTIASIVAEDEAAVRAAAADIAENLRRTALPIASIGAFTPYVIFLAPVMTHDLRIACEVANDRFGPISTPGNHGNYLPGSWAPHIAVGLKLGGEALQKAFCVVQGMFTPFLANATELVLTKWEAHDPYQILVRYSLK